MPSSSTTLPPSTSSSTTTLTRSLNSTIGGPFASSSSSPTKEDPFYRGIPQEPRYAMPEELYRLIGGNAPTLVLGKKKQKRAAEEGNLNKKLKRARTWQWTDFDNQARRDDLRLFHWEKVHDNDDENDNDTSPSTTTMYPFAKYNVSTNVYSYSSDEYVSHLRDPTGDWSKEETDYLFSLCHAYDLRWYVIRDRWEWPPPSTSAAPSDQQQLDDGRQQQQQGKDGLQQPVDANRAAEATAAAATTTTTTDKSNSENRGLAGQGSDKDVEMKDVDAREKADETEHGGPQGGLASEQGNKEDVAAASSEATAAQSKSASGPSGIAETVEASVVRETPEEEDEAALLAKQAKTENGEEQGSISSAQQNQESTKSNKDDVSASTTETAGASVAPAPPNGTASAPQGEASRAQPTSSSSITTAATPSTVPSANAAVTTVGQTAKDRTIEELKDRYYSVCRRLIRNRPASDEAAKASLLHSYAYEKERDMLRKKHIRENLLTHSAEQSAEEEFLYVESRRLEETFMRTQRERDELWRLLGGIGPQSSSALAQNSPFLSQAAQANAMAAAAAAAGGAGGGASGLVGGASGGGAAGGAGSSNANKKKRRGELDLLEQNPGAGGGGAAAATGGKDQPGFPAPLTPAQDAQYCITRYTNPDGTPLLPPLNASTSSSSSSSASAAAATTTSLLPSGPAASVVRPSGVYLRSSKPPQLKTSVAPKIQAALAEHKISMRLAMPTRNNMEKLEALVVAITSLLDVKKQVERAEFELKVLKTRKEAAKRIEEEDRRAAAAAAAAAAAEAEATASVEKKASKEGDTTIAAARGGSDDNSAKEGGSGEEGKRKTETASSPSAMQVD